MSTISFHLSSSSSPDAINWMATADSARDRSARVSRIKARNLEQVNVNRS